MAAATPTVLASVTPTSVFATAESVLSSLTDTANNGMSGFFGLFPRTLLNFASKTLPVVSDDYAVGGPGEALGGLTIPSVVETLTRDTIEATMTHAPDLGRQGVEHFLSAGGGAQRGVGNILSYMTSSWAILCVFMAILLNRTFIYASLRRPLRLTFLHRLLIRVPPILLFINHLAQLLIAIHNQTGPTASHPSQALHNFTYPASQLYGSWLGNAATSGSKLPGSVTLLWPLYRTLCFSHFTEVFVCALTSRSLASETGMTLLEYSLAFAEAESVADTRYAVTRSLQTESEVLIVAALSAGSHLTAHVLGLLGLQSRLRLYSTAFWGLLNLSVIGGWGLLGGRLGGFPTVCVVGFVPHLLILAGITMCLTIYLLALLLTSISPPQPAEEGGGQGNRPSFSLGFQNLQANLTLQTLTLNPAEDFYTSLLKLGFCALSAASDATYLNEGRPIRVPGLTWVESERKRMLERESKWREHGLLKAKAMDGGSSTKVGGYSREKKELADMQTGTGGKGKSGTSTSNANLAGSGDLNARSIRWWLAWELMRGISIIITRWSIMSASRLWHKCFSRKRVSADRRTNSQVPNNEWVDNGAWLDQNAIDDEELQTILYRRFLAGGNFGEGDDSSDYVPDDDYYNSESETETETDIDHLNDDRSTPTPDSCRSSSVALYSRESSPMPSQPFSELFPTPQTLANLISPRTTEQHETSRLLASHLRSDHILTRSRHRALADENDLEHILLSRRGVTLDAHDSTAHDNKKAGNRKEELWGEDGIPMCVVCQSAPRTILVWPCRCLALCEDCRVCLAMNNYGFCSCCRREVSGFSRIYVP